MPSEGKVGSLFVQFRTNIDQLIAEMRRATNEMLSFGATVSSVSKGVSDLGHLGSASVNKFANDLGQLTSGLSTVNTFIAKTSNEAANIGHLGSVAVNKFANDLGHLTSELSTANTFIAKTSNEAANMGHLGSAAVNEFANDLGHLTSGLSTVNTHVQGVAAGIADLGHLGSQAARQTVSSFTASFAGISNEIRRFDRIFYPFQRIANTIGYGLSAALTAPLVGAGALALKTGIDFEAAFARVRQTVDATEPELAALRQQLIDMSTVTPLSAKEFADIAAIAGQLGIESSSIASFANTMAQLGSATKLSAVEASNFLARFANITRLPDDKIHNLASTLFALGKEFPAVEGEIANFGLRIARVGTFVGLADSEILAFATALASVGVSAEQGGTAISRVFADIDKAVSAGGVRLEQFAAVSKKPVAEFVQLFKTDAPAAVVAFVEGLRRIRLEGGNVFAVLDSMRLSNVRVRDTLLALAQGSGELTTALDVARNEWVSNNSLIEAFAEKNKTTAAQLKILRNQIEAVGISLFDIFAPALNEVVIPAIKRLIDDGLKPAVEWFGKTDSGMKTFVGGTAIAAAALGPSLLIAAKSIQFFGDVGIILSKPIGALTNLKKVIVDVGGAIGSLASGRGFGQIIGMITAPIAIPWWLSAAFYAAVLYEVYRLADGYRELLEQQEEAQRAQIGADNAVFESLAKLKKLGFDIDTRGKSIQDLRELVHNIVSSMGKIDLSGEKGGIKIPSHIGPSPEELEEQAELAAKLAEEHARLTEKFVAELLPTNELNRELSYLLKHFDIGDVISVYAKRIVDATEAQWDHNYAVSGAAGAYYEQAKAIQTVADMLKEIAREPVPTISLPIPGELPGPATNALELKALTDFADAKKQIEQLGNAIKNLDFLSPSQQIALFDGQLDQAVKLSKMLGIELDPVIEDLLRQREAAEQSAADMKAWEDAVNAGVNKADEMAGQIATTGEAIRRMQDLGYDAAQIIDILGGTIDEAGENARILKIELDPTIIALIKLRREAKEAADEVKRFDKIMAQVTAQIITDFANGIADILLGAKSIVDVATKIARDFAAAFIKTLTAELFAPLVKKFQELGEHIASILKKFAGAHPVIAGIVGAAVAAVAVIKALGNAHLFANQFVKETQNPFGKSLSEFVNAANELYAVGRQTYEGARQAEAKVREMWQGFLEDAQKFGEQGRKQAAVAAQGIATLEPVIRGVFANIQAQILALKPPALRAVESVENVEQYRQAVARNTAERMAALREEYDAIIEQINAIQKEIIYQQELGNGTDDLSDQMRELVYQMNDLYDAMHPAIATIYSFAEAARTVSETLAPDKTLGFVEQVINATAGAANLEEALGILEQIGTPVGIIIDRLGNDVQEFANALELSGLPIPPLIEKYLNLANVSRNVGDGIPRIANSLSKLVGDAVEKLRQIAGGGDLAQGILDALARLLTGLPEPRSIDTSQNAVRDAVDKLRGVTENILAELQSLELPPSQVPVQSADLLPSPTFATPSPVTIMQMVVNITDNGAVSNEFTFTEKVSRTTVRDEIIPEITEALLNNPDSTREKWVRILRGTWNGVAQK